jgi:hypothetical protein
MIFSQPMIDRILAGEKTQTRRHSGRYKVGKTYAVQPGRGKPAVAHIQILEKGRELVGMISTADAIAEGFDSRQRFLEAWEVLHGPRADVSVPVWVYGFRLVE